MWTKTATALALTTTGIAYNKSKLICLYLTEWFAQQTEFKTVFNSFLIGNSEVPSMAVFAAYLPENRQSNAQRLAGFLSLYSLAIKT